MANGRGQARPARPGWQLVAPLAVGLEVPGGVPEVIERELGYHGLDHSPEGFAQRGSELERSDFLELSGIDRAAIRLEKRLLLGIREAGIGRNAGQVKERMAHAVWTTPALIAPQRDISPRRTVRRHFRRLTRGAFTTRGSGVERKTLAGVL